MKTRLDYLNDKCTHREYYAQFVTASTLRTINSRISKKELIKANNKDSYLNSIPLSTWDGIGVSINSSSLNAKQREAGDYTTKAGLVCIAKEAARQIIEA